MNRDRVIKWGALLLLTAVTMLLLVYYLRTELRITAGELGAPLDDAWIHFQFARNLSQGFGFSYNPGEPTPGSTAPLWTLLLAAVGRFSTDFLRPALALSAFFLLLTVWLAYGFTRWITRSAWAALLAGLGVALTGRLLWAGLAGMETTAFAALSLAAIWAYSKWGLRALYSVALCPGWAAAPRRARAVRSGRVRCCLGLVAGSPRNGRRIVAIAVAPICPPVTRLRPDRGPLHGI